MTDSWPPAFSLDQERILTLLTGDRFYTDPSAALREAVLNALDAVHRLSQMDSQLVPEIVVQFDHNRLALVISDNGDGMDRAAISQLFTRVGASAAQLGTGKGSVGEFGIGVVSYFMAADAFEIHTTDGVSDPVSLMFRREMLAGGGAAEVAGDRTERGTTLVLHIRDQQTFELLQSKFSFWCRDVQCLRATRLPEGQVLQQGIVRRTSPITVAQLPAWIEQAHLFPVVGAAAWDAMTGTSNITILYRGVFVQEFAPDALWGMEGSIDVDPKHFRPRLNREGFVGNEFKAEVLQFLKDIHPQILASMADQLAAAVASGALDKWSESRWATLWLSIPRDAPYADAARRWDAIFRTLPAFELAMGDKWTPLSLNGLLALVGPIYVAPHKDERVNDVVSSAVRLLRHTQPNVIRGLRRDPGYLRNAGNYFGTTADLISQVFSAEIPPLVSIAAQAESILLQVRRSASLYGGSIPIDLVRIGEDSPPVLKLNHRLILNLDTEIGRTIVQEVIQRNSGRWALVESVARLAHDYVSQVASAVREGAPAHQESLGLLKRRQLRELLQ